jgi:hypothetical protein
MICIAHAWESTWVWGYMCMGFCLPSHSIFLFGFICFLLCIVHQVGPPPSFNFWVDSLHLWPVFRSHIGGPTFFIVPMVENKLHPMMLFGILSFPSQMMGGFMLHVSKFMSFYHLPFNLFDNGLTLCYQLMASTFWSMLSLLILPK